MKYLKLTIQSFYVFQQTCHLHKRFCGAEGVENIETLSAFRDIQGFANSYGVAILDTSLKGLTSRAVVILDEHNKVIYSELAPEITEEPDYTSALSTLS